MCLKGKKWHDLKLSICGKKLAVESVILLHNTRYKKDMSRKWFFKWLGPYRFFDAIKDKSTYLLKEFDGSRLAGIFAGDRLKRFHSQQQLHLDHAQT